MVDRAAAEKINLDSYSFLGTGETCCTCALPGSRSLVVTCSASPICLFGQAFISQKLDLCLLWIGHYGKDGRYN